MNLYSLSKLIRAAVGYNAAQEATLACERS